MRLLNALIGQIEASEKRRVPRYSIAKSMRILPSTLSKWTLGRTKLDQIDALLTLIRLLPDEERWIKEFRLALQALDSSKRKKPSPKSI
jgi:hypothetical protein